MLLANYRLLQKYKQGDTHSLFLQIASIAIIIMEANNDKISHEEVAAWGGTTPFGVEML